MMHKTAVRRRNWLPGAAGAMALALTWGAFAAPRFADLPGSKAARSTEVDVELVMAVDISYSMDMDELALQREGYAQAIASQEFLNALKQGTHSKIAVTLVEWAGVSDQRIVVPWRLIDGAASAQAVSEEMARAPVRRAFRSAAVISASGIRTVQPRSSSSGSLPRRYGAAPGSRWNAASALSLLPPQLALKYAAMGAAPQVSTSPAVARAASSAGLGVRAAFR